MATLIVRNVDEAIVKSLKERARRNGRSMEAEHRALLRQMAPSNFDEEERARFIRAAEELRKSMAGQKQVHSEELLREIRDEHAK